MVRRRVCQETTKEEEEEEKRRKKEEYIKSCYEPNMQRSWEVRRAKTGQMPKAGGGGTSVNAHAHRFE